ncbi:MAG: type 4b pilus protein PilO2 [Burkholderiales bacterium]|nr:type 4b pilus protein PilO2 [Burkholderiales bacterium]
MQVLKNSSIAVGLEWTLHDTVSEAKKAVAGKSNILLARKVISGECVQGICKTPVKNKKLQAGALLAAAAANDVLIFHSLGDGNVWVCAVREGIPLHGFDVVVDENSAKAKFAEVMSYVPTAAVYGDLSGAKGSLADLFADLTSADKKAAALAAPDNPVVIVTLVAIIVVLGTAATFMYRFFENKTADPIARQMQNNEETRRARMAFENEIKRARQDFWHAPSPSRQFDVWYELLHSLPVSVNGWTPSAFNCDAAVCKVTWKRDDRALFAAVADLPGTPVPQPFNAAMKESVTSFALSNVAATSHGGGRPGTDHYIRDVGISIMNQYRVVLATTEKQVTVAPPAGSQGMAPVVIGQERGWKATGSNPLLASDFLERIEWPGVVLSTISIKNLNLGRPQYTIELEGRYRVGS